MALNLTIAFIALAITAQAQLAVRDSLKARLDVHSARDSTKVDLLTRLAYEDYLTEPGRSLQYSYEALQISKDIAYLNGEAQSLRQIGIVMWSQANYASALKHFFAGLKIADSTRDEQLIADITGNLGLVYHGLGEYDEAFKYHQRSLDMQRRLKNRAREAVAANNLGDVYRALKQYPQALEKYSEALDLRKQTGNPAGVATNLRNIGNVFEEQGLYEKALQHYFESLRISDDIGEKRGMSQARYSIASVYSKLRQLDRAARFAHEGLDIAKQAKFRTTIRDCYLLLSDIANKQTDVKESYNFFRQYAMYKDSVHNLQTASEIASQRLDYEISKKESEISLLKKDAVIKEELIDRKNTLLLTGLVILAILSLLVYIIFRHYKGQRRVNAVLAAKNAEIEKQHLEIASQRDELIALNEEIRAQQDDLVASHNALEQKNLSIAEMNERILRTNQNLERLVQERTAVLERQNRQLVEYAFINAHKVRGPLARVMGLANLLSLTAKDEEQRKLLSLLEDAAVELDHVTRSITDVVQDGLDAYEHKGNL